MLRTEAISAIWILRLTLTLTLTITVNLTLLIVKAALTLTYPNPSQNTVLAAVYCHIWQLAGLYLAAM